MGSVEAGFTLLLLQAAANSDNNNAKHSALKREYRNSKNGCMNNGRGLSVTRFKKCQCQPTPA
jgi:hypothetical protein